MLIDNWVIIISTGQLYCSVTKLIKSFSSDDLESVWVLCIATVLRDHYYFLPLLRTPTPCQLDVSGWFVSRRLLCKQLAQRWLQSWRFSASFRLLSFHGMHDLLGWSIRWQLGLHDWRVFVVFKDFLLYLVLSWFRLHFEDGKDAVFHLPHFFYLNLESDEFLHVSHIKAYC